MFSGLKDKLKIGIGAIRLAVFGDTKWGERHWNLEKRGYDQNIFVEEDTFDNAVFGGDSGKCGPQRDAVMEALRAEGLERMIALGDLGYPDGVKDEAEYKLHISGLYADLGPNHKSSDLVDGNHDEYGSRSERAFLNKKLFTGSDGKIRKPNFYWARVYNNVMIVAFDSTVYDVKIGDPEIQERQEKFVHKVLRDSRFKHLYKIVIAHAGIYSRGSHGKTHSKDHEKFFKRSIMGQAHAMVCGHDHLIDFYGLVGDTEIWTSGAMSKIKDGEKLKARPGYVLFKAGKFSLKYVDVAVPLMQDEDDD